MEEAFAGPVWQILIAQNVTVPPHMHIPALRALTTHTMEAKIHGGLSIVISLDTGLKQ